MSSMLASLTVQPEISGDFAGSLLRITLKLDGQLPESGYIPTGVYGIVGTASDEENYNITWNNGKLTIGAVETS